MLTFPLNLWKSLFLFLWGSFAPDLYWHIFICVVASSLLITLKMLGCGFPTTFFKWECQHDCWCVGHQNWNSSIVGTGTAHWSTCIYYKLKLSSCVLWTTRSYIKVGVNHMGIDFVRNWFCENWFHMNWSRGSWFHESWSRGTESFEMFFLLFPGGVATYEPIILQACHTYYHCRMQYLGNITDSLP